MVQVEKPRIATLLAVAGNMQEGVVNRLPEIHYQARRVRRKESWTVGHSHFVMASPSTVLFDQQQTRMHLVECLQSGKIVPLPARDPLQQTNKRR